MGIAVLASKFDGIIYLFNFMELMPLHFNWRKKKMSKGRYDKICGKGYPLQIFTLETHVCVFSLLGNAYVLLTDYYFFRKDCRQMKA